MISVKKTKSFLIRVIALILFFSISAPLSVSAATSDTITPRASYYLGSYNTYICDMGNGRMEIWYDVTGTGDMDEIGVLSILLFESTDNTNWTRVKTYSHEKYPSMLAYDDWSHTSCVSYQGVAGRYYKAYVCIWAGKNGLGDTRYMWARMV